MREPFKKKKKIHERDSIEGWTQTIEVEKEVLRWENTFGVTVHFWVNNYLPLG